MSEWKFVRIGDIAIDLAMGPFGSDIKSSYFVVDGVPVIRGGNLLNCQFHDENFVFLTEEKADSLKRSNAYPGDLVFTHRGTLGQVALIPHNARYLRYVVSQSQMRLTCNVDVVDPRYVYYYFLSPMGQRELLKNTSTTGVPAISQPLSSLKKMEIPLPPLPTQKKIAAILSSLDDKIEINTRMNKVLEEIARALFHRWFVEFEFPNDEGKPYKSSGGRMIASEMGEIPEGWSVGSVGDIADLNPESWSNKNRPKSINYLDLSNVRNGNIQNILSCPFDIAPSRARRILRMGDTIIGTVRPGNRSFALVPEIGLTGSTGFAVLRSHSMSTQYYLYLHLTQDSMIQMFTLLATGGAYPAITPQLIVEQTILLPPKENLSLFHESMSAIFHRINMNAREIRFLSEIREHLLPKLLSVQE